jgi:hypothetical protein
MIFFVVGKDLEIIGKILIILIGFQISFWRTVTTGCNICPVIFGTIAYVYVRLHVAIRELLKGFL